jgi:hypothetical protein
MEVMRSKRVGRWAGRLALLVAMAPLAARAEKPQAGQVYQLKLNGPLGILDLTGDLLVAAGSGGSAHVRMVVDGSGLISGQWTFSVSSLSLSVSGPITGSLAPDPDLPDTTRLTMKWSASGSAFGEPATVVFKFRARIRHSDNLMKGSFTIKMCFSDDCGTIDDDLAGLLDLPWRLKMWIDSVSGSAIRGRGVAKLTTPADSGFLGLEGEFTPIPRARKFTLTGEFDQEADLTAFDLLGTHDAAGSRIRIKDAEVVEGQLAEASVRVHLLGQKRSKRYRR